MVVSSLLAKIRQKYDSSKKTKQNMFFELYYLVVNEKSRTFAVV